MADSIQSKLIGSLQGVTCQGALTPVPIKFILDEQDAHNQLTVVVEPTDINKLVVLPSMQGPAGAAQTLLMLSTDQNVQVRLNNIGDLTFSMSAAGPLVIPGLPDITQLEFTGIAGVEANVFITKIIGTQTLPVPPATPPIPAGNNKLDTFSATLSQTVFNLSSTPTNPTATLFFVEGVMYAGPSFFTLIGTTLTWLDVPFTLPAGARVDVFYQ